MGLADFSGFLGTTAPKAERGGTLATGLNGRGHAARRAAEKGLNGAAAAERGREFVNSFSLFEEIIAGSSPGLTVLLLTVIEGKDNGAILDAPKNEPKKKKLEGGQISDRRSLDTTNHKGNVTIHNDHRTGDTL